MPRTDVLVRLGALEDVGRSESAELGLRVFVGQRSASVSTSDLSDDALADAGRARGGDGAARRPRIRGPGSRPPIG